MDEFQNNYAEYKKPESLHPTKREYCMISFIENSRKYKLTLSVKKKKKTSMMRKKCRREGLQNHEEILADHMTGMFPILRVLTISRVYTFVKTSIVHRKYVQLIVIIPQ